MVQILVKQGLQYNHFGGRFSRRLNRHTEAVEKAAAEKKEKAEAEEGAGRELAGDFCDLRGTASFPHRRSQRNQRPGDARPSRVKFVLKMSCVDSMGTQVPVLFVDSRALFAIMGVPSQATGLF